MTLRCAFKYTQLYLSMSNLVDALVHLFLCKALPHSIPVHTLQTCCKFYAVTYLSVKEYVARLVVQKAEKQIFATEVSHAM
jgi:hypothetical protein